MSLDESLIEKVKARDQQNIARRAAEGKPLTKGQLDRLAKREEDRIQWRRLKKPEVCLALNCSHNTLNNWLDIGCPSVTDGEGAARLDMREVMDWKVAHEVKRACSSSDVAGEFSEQLERYRKIKADAAEFDLGIKKTKFLAIDDVRQMTRTMAERTRASLQAIARNAAIRLAAAQDPDECEEIIQREINQALKVLATAPPDDQPDSQN